MSTNSKIRAKWIIQNYGKANALFHAIRFGENFISMELVIFLIAEEKVNLSRYLAQRLLLQFGRKDDSLIEPTISNDIDITINNNNNSNANNASKVTQNSFRNPWASNIPLNVFGYLLNEAEKRCGPGIPLRGNDIELFYFLTGGPLAIDLAPGKLKENLEEIKDLILDKKFVPFPPRPTILFEDTIKYQIEMQIINCEKYPAKDGFENNEQLNTIARAILIYPEIVELWKQIGYTDICIDVNNLVLRDSLTILYPNSKNEDCLLSPTTSDFVERIRQFVEVGFKLTKSVMVDILFLYEHDLTKIGESLVEAFQIVRNQPKIEIVGRCIVEAIKINRNSKTHQVLDFLKVQLKENDLEPIYLRALAYHYFDDTIKNKIEFQNFKSSSFYARINNKNSKFTNNVNLTSDKEIIEEEPINYYHACGYKYHPHDTTIRTLKLSSNLYKWVLKNFNPDSIVTRLCFDDIIISKSWIDRELLLYPERQTPEQITSCAFKLIVFVYNEFCKSNVPFELVHLNLLKKSNNFTTLEPFFEGFLPQIFNINPTFDYYCNDNNNTKKIGSKVEERTKFWFIELEKIHGQMNTRFNVTTTHDQFTANFKICMERFWDRIVSETDYINQFQSKKRKCALNHGKGGSKAQKAARTRKLNCKQR